MNIALGPSESATSHLLFLAGGKHFPLEAMAWTPGWGQESSDRSQLREPCTQKINKCQPQGAGLLSIAATNT